MFSDFHWTTPRYRRQGKKEEKPEGEGLPATLLLVSN